jgi:hypothetical protein
VSDHGFTRIEKSLRPAVRLGEAGLIDVDEDGKVKSWSAGVQTCAGSAFIYLRDPRDAATAARVRKLFADMAGKPGSGVGRILEADDLQKLGADPRALFALEAAEGWSFAPGVTGPPVVAPSKDQGTHGYDSRRPDMRASLILHVPGSPPGRITGARQLDVAPTVAAWLALKLPSAEGRSLLVKESPASGEHP